MGLTSGGAGVAAFKNRFKSEDADMKKIVESKKLLASAMEKAKAMTGDIELMAERLGRIGSRMPTLEGSISPLQYSSSDVTTLGGQIDRALKPASVLLEKFNHLHSLEATILGDPKEDIGGYLLAVTQMEESLRFLSSSSPLALRRLQEAVQSVSNIRDQTRFARMQEALSQAKDTSCPDGGLVQVAMDKLLLEFNRLLRENGVTESLPSIISPSKISPGMKPTGKASTPLPLPVPVIQKLHSIAKRMAANEKTGMCTSAYVEDRRQRCQEAILSLKPGYFQLSGLKGVDSLEWGTLEAFIGEWTQHFEVAVKILYQHERKLCEKIFGGIDQEVYFPEIFCKIIRPGMGAFLNFGHLVSRSRKAPEKLFKLLDMFEALQNLQPSLNELLEGGEGCSELRLRARELQKQVVHAACQVFWEFTRQIESQREGPVVADAGVFKLTSYVVNYILYLLTEFYSPIMDQVLKIEQSWREAQPPEGENGKGLYKAVLGIMEALENAIQGRSKGYTDQAQCHIFLMNNYYYLFSRIKGSDLGSLLGDAWLKDKKSRVQQHVLGYQKEGWGKVLKHLNREGLFSSGSNGKGPASRELVRQRIRAFLAEFEEACQKQRTWTIQDPDLRDGTRLSILQTVVPAYRSYFQHFGSLIDGSGYSRLPAETVEQALGELFLGRDAVNGMAPPP